jgi:arabinogalactan endo-1,4-beta-galactosidase
MMSTERKDCLQLLKKRTQNEYLRLQYLSTSQDKASGHCSAAETVVMALRAQKPKCVRSVRYSDTWADPKQMACCWSNLSFDALQNKSMNMHGVLTALKWQVLRLNGFRWGMKFQAECFWPDGALN